jgi:hypothetical protein
LSTAAIAIAVNPKPDGVVIAPIAGIGNFSSHQVRSLRRGAPETHPKDERNKR